MEQKDAWDSFYSTNKRPWRGVSKINIPFSTSSHVLELGCGNGKTAAALLMAGMKVTAVDFSEEAISICKEFVPNANFVCADITELPFDDNIFDGALAFHVFEHLSEKSLSKSISEIHRVLKPGAHLIVKVFSIDDMRSEKGTKIDENTVERGNGITYRYFTEQSLSNAISGFDIVFISTTHENTKFGTTRSRIEADFIRSA